MPVIALDINGRAYEMTCDDGQEAHLQKLAAHIDGKVRQLVTSVGQVGEGRLLVMASLLIADELFDAYQRIEELSADAGNRRGQGEGAVEVLDACAQRIEAIAERLVSA